MFYVLQLLRTRYNYVMSGKTKYLYVFIYCRNTNQAEIDSQIFSQIVGDLIFTSPRFRDTWQSYLRPDDRNRVPLNRQTLINGDDNFHLQLAILDSKGRFRNGLINGC